MMAYARRSANTPTTASSSSSLPSLPYGTSDDKAARTSRTSRDESHDYSDNFDSEEEMDDDQRSPTPDGISPLRSSDSDYRYGTSAYTDCESYASTDDTYHSSVTPALPPTPLKLPAIATALPRQQAPPAGNKFSVACAGQRQQHRGVGGAAVRAPAIATVPTTQRRKPPPAPVYPSKGKPRLNRVSNWGTTVTRKPQPLASQGISPVSLSSRTGPPTNASLRLTSAKRNRVAKLKNELQTALDQLEEVKRENKVLQQQSLRNEKALRRYESQDADLPNILKRHEEEDKMLRQQVRTLKLSVGAVEQKLQTRQAELQQSQRKCNKLEQLVQARELKERAQLTGELQAFNDKLDQRDVDIQRLQRQLETAEKSRRRTDAKARKELSAMETALRNRDEGMRRTQTRLEEKEKALEVKNIYSQRIMRNMPRNLPPIATTRSVSTSTDDLPVPTPRPRTQTLALGSDGPLLLASGISQGSVGIGVSPLQQVAGGVTSSLSQITSDAHSPAGPQSSSRLAVSQTNLQPATTPSSEPATVDATAREASRSEVPSTSQAVQTSSSNLAATAATTAATSHLHGITAGVERTGIDATGQSALEPITETRGVPNPATSQRVETFAIPMTDNTLAKSLPPGPYLIASSSTPSLHVNEPPVKFQPTRMSTGVGPTGGKTPGTGQSAPGGPPPGSGPSLPAAADAKALLPSPEAQRAAQEQEQARREAVEKKRKLLAALGQAPPAETPGRPGQSTARDQEPPAEARGFESAATPTAPSPASTQSKLLDDATKQRVKQDLKRMLMHSDTEGEGEKTPSNNDSMTTVAGSEPSIGHGARGGRASPPSWSRPVENLHSGRPASYGEAGGGSRRAGGAGTGKDFWNADKRIGSASSLLVQKGESEVDERIVRHKPPTGQQVRRRRTGPLLSGGHSSEVTTTTTTTNSSLEQARHTGGPNPSLFQQQQQQQQQQRNEPEGARRSLMRRPRNSAVPDTTDDEAYDRQPIRRPPARAAAAKANSRVLASSDTTTTTSSRAAPPAHGGLQHSPAQLQPPAGFKLPPAGFKLPRGADGRSSNYAAPQQGDGADAGARSGGVFGASPSLIDVDGLPQTTSQPDLKQPARRTFQFNEDDDDDDLEEIDAT